MNERAQHHLAPWDGLKAPSPAIPAQRPVPPAETDIVQASESDTVQLQARRPAAKEPQRAATSGARTAAAGRGFTPARLVTRSAWSVWAVTFAVGVVVFEWQAVVPLFSLHTLSGVLACFVLLRPSAVWRTMLLCAVEAVELIALLPNPYSASLLMHLSAVALTVWYGVELLRTRTLVHDRGAVFERIAPFLRWGFLLAWFSDAISKLNTGFLATIGSCAPDVLDDIPIVHTPQSLYGAVAIVTLVLEFAIPTLLLIRATRAIGVVLAIGWYLIIAAGGNPAHSAIMLSFVLLFVPPAVLVAAGARMRLMGRRLGRGPLRALADSPWAPAILAAVWLAGLTVAALLPFELSVRLSRWSAILMTAAWLGLWIYLLLAQHRQWLTGGDRSTSLRVRDGVLIAALGVILLNIASPYLGYKTDGSFSQYGNLRTEAGHWNHLVIPEAVRIVDAQDHLVRLVHATGDHELLKLVDANAGSQFVLLDAKRLLAPYPYATLDYELDGVMHHTDRLGKDPNLGGGVDWFTDLVGRFRRVPLAPTCQF
ncbi:hypothetical protein [Pseudonocardia sp.]|uniref:hypothetical protein n=1 Tax=Pseudonocardia sp. TaxID=60912 RepID=UPI003D126461